MERPDFFSINRMFYCYYRKMMRNTPTFQKNTLYPGLRIILSGQLSFDYYDTEFVAKKGDIILHRKNENYTMVAKDCTVEYITVFFSCEPEDIIDAYFGKEHVFTPCRTGRYIDSFERLANVYFSLDFLAKPLLCALTQELLCNIFTDYHYASKKIKADFALIAKKFIDEYFSNNLSSQDIAKAAGCSVSYLRKVFIKAHGEPPHKYLNRVRIENAKEMLSSRIYSIEETALACGFKNVYYFNKVFSQYTGVTPGKY